MGFGKGSRDFRFEIGIADPGQIMLAIYNQRVYFV
jgi:hypothetical protein